MKKHRGNRGRKAVLGLLVMVSLGGAYAAWALRQPLPDIAPVQQSRLITAQAAGSSFIWPATGQAAVGIVGAPAIETNTSQQPVPIASTAKVITALTVLDKFPLKKGEQGASITMTDRDVMLYRTELTQDGSNLPIAIGDKLTEYQMIQALMLPSANNIANSLAIWAFGSLEGYTTAANAYLAKNGLTSTTVGTDASGLSPTTTSTAQDLVKLGKLAMQDPALSEIVGQSTATNLGQAKEVYNVNSLLGTSNIVGIKTGNSVEAGGAFMSASKVTINNKPVTIVTAVLAAPDRPTALRTSLALVRSAQINFKPVTVVKKGQTVGSYALPWGGTVKATADSDLTLTSWNGSTTTATIRLNPIVAHMSPLAERGSVGRVSVNKSDINPELGTDIYIDSIPQPSNWWRLTHPF